MFMFSALLLFIHFVHCSVLSSLSFLPLPPTPLVFGNLLSLLVNLMVICLKGKNHLYFLSEATASHIFETCSTNLLQLFYLKSFKQIFSLFKIRDFLFTQSLFVTNRASLCILHLSSKSHILPDNYTFYQQLPLNFTTNFLGFGLLSQFAD